MTRPNHPFVPHKPAPVSPVDGLSRGQRLFDELDARRSVRFFSDAPVPREMIEIAIRTASTAPSGAHMQPWTFVAISDLVIKAKIREAAEAEEYASYEGGRMPEDWREALEPLGTDWRKPFLETVPWIVVLFAQSYGFTADGQKKKHYYVKESVGLAGGLFVASLHRMGLSTLTHTPSPMGFLTEILGRPSNEKPFILFPVGYAADDCVVPDLERKPLDAVSAWFDG
ncbi:MAG: nitroreductase family protein [Proteobacteria bacterium]|nr:nitroreductase family protein [Pseudomonadota bacterium]